MVFRYRVCLLAAICLANIAYSIAYSIASARILSANTPVQTTPTTTVQDRREVAVATDALRRRLVEPDSSGMDGTKSDGNTVPAEQQQQQQLQSVEDGAAAADKPNPEDSADATQQQQQKQPQQDDASGNPHVDSGEMGDQTRASEPPGTDTSGGTTPQDQKPSACTDAKTCNECKTAAQLVESTMQGYTCVFKLDDVNGAIDCQLISKDQAPPTADMCSHHSSNDKTKQQEAAPQDNDWDDDGSGGGSFASVVGISAVLLIGAAFYRFKKGNAGFSADNDNSAPNDFASVMGGAMTAYSKKET
jgi:hypothetical protein